MIAYTTDQSIGAPRRVGALASILLVGASLLVGCSDGEARPDREAPAGTASAPAVTGSMDPVDSIVSSPERPDNRTVASDRAADGTAPGGAPSASPAATASTGSGSPRGDESPPAASSSATSGSTGAGATDGDPRPPSSQDPTPERILRATSRAYEGLRSFRAGFDQRLRNTLLGRTTESRGTLYQRQPDRFLMDFSDPEGDLIVSDGAYFWMYFPSVDEKQVLRTPRGAQGLDLHAQFIGDPVQRFEVTYHGTEAVRGRRAHVMTLVPREPAGYRSLKAWIDADDHLVRRFELAEPNGNLRFFELYDMVLNPSLSDDLFEFTPPPGSQVVTR